MTTGGRARLLRAAVGVEQTALAKRAGFGRSTVSNLERDLHKPHETTLAAVAGALAVPVEALLDDDACLRELARLMGQPAPATSPAPTPAPSAEAAAMLARAVIRATKGSEFGYREPDVDEDDQVRRLAPLLERFMQVGGGK